MKLLRSALCALALVSSLHAVGTHLKGEKPLSIAQGRQVNLAEFLVTGKITVFEFTSEYCPPCRAYAEPLYLLHRDRADLAVVKVDIDRPEVHRIDWDSPVAQQYDVHTVPLFKVYGPDGKLIAEDTTSERPARNLVNRWINALN